jgi:putative ABC transport system permease protein
VQITDLVRLSVRQIYRNKRRYRGVIIGISLGLAGLVTVLSLGDSVEQELGRNLELLGSATIVKATWDVYRTERWHHGEYYPRDIRDLKRLPGVLWVSPAVWSYNYQANYGNSTPANCRLLGIEPSFFECIHLPVVSGRAITDADVSYRKNVCVLGRKVITKLFGKDADPLGLNIFIGGHMFQVIGVLGGVEDESFLETILVPISVARSKFNAMYAIRDIYMRAENWDIVPRLQQDALRTLTRNQPAYADAIQVQYFPEGISTIKKTVLVVKLFVYASILVTLFLGGLGVSNVMLAAVRERTTEIGLRKAVGATDRMIMSQFLTESVGISLLGAAVGMVIATVSVQALATLFGTVPAYDVFMWSLLAGLLFGIILGILSGLLPARRASGLDAADAMRFE